MIYIKINVVDTRLFGRKTIAHCNERNTVVPVKRNMDESSLKRE